MSRRQFYRLDGSYRLPVRISECIKKLSEAIVERFGNDEGVTDITPYKGSPPGSRPIVVYGQSYIQVAEKVKQVFEYYKIYDLQKITILEKDIELQRAIVQQGITSETDTILSLKGLEKECVLWSTRIPLEFENEVFEFAYTIVTRTSCILIIALTDNTKNIYKKILGLLNSNRLIMWDKETADKFHTFCEEYKPETIIDEDQDKIKPILCSHTHLQFAQSHCTNQKWQKSFPPLPLKLFFLAPYPSKKINFQLSH